RSGSWWRGRRVKTYADTLDDQIRAIEKCKGSLHPLHHELARDLTNADSYFAKEDFLSLVDAAADQLPASDLLPEDIPSPVGWITLAASIPQEALIRASSAVKVRAPKDSRGLFSGGLPGIHVQ